MSTVILWVGMFSLSVIGILLGAWIVQLYSTHIRNRPNEKERRILDIIIKDMKDNPNNWVYLEHPDKVAINDVRGIWVKDSAGRISIYMGITTSLTGASREHAEVFELKIERNIAKYINKIEGILKHKDIELDFMLSKLEESNEKPNEM